MKMINKNIIALTIFIGLLFTSCSSDNEDFTEKPEIKEDNVNPNPATTEPSSELDVENFFYRGMNDIYLYKKDLSLLADDYF